MTARRDSRLWPVNNELLAPPGTWRNNSGGGRASMRTRGTTGTTRPRWETTDTVPTRRPMPNDVDESGVGAELVLERIVCRFGPVTAVDGVDLAVGVGQRQALVGPNGAGKTTLLNIIAGTVRHIGGRVCYHDRDITRHGAARRARAGIARTFQQPACYPSLTLAEHLLLAAWPHTRASLRWHHGRRKELVEQGMVWLERFGMRHLADRPAGVLSHGQRRLLDLATALAGTPRLLLLDEPAAGLADADLHRLLTALRDLPAQVGVLLVEHNLDVVAAVAQQVTVLHQGRVLATGTPEQIRADREVQQIYLGADASGGRDVQY